MPADVAIPFHHVAIAGQMDLREIITVDGTDVIGGKLVGSGASGKPVESGENGGTVEIGMTAEAGIINRTTAGEFEEPSLTGGLFAFGVNESSVNVSLLETFPPPRGSRKKGVHHVQRYRQTNEW